MNVEEAIEIIKEARFDINTKINGTTRFSQALEIAIEALEQQSFMNKPCVVHQVCPEDKVKMLDKIRAEIESVIQEETVIVHPEARNGYERIVSKLDPDDVFQIINKYKAEVRNEE